MRINKYLSSKYLDVFLRRCLSQNCFIYVAITEKKEDTNGLRIWSHLKLAWSTAIFRIYSKIGFDVLNK